jgi:hypothetical protein
MSRKWTPDLRHLRVAISDDRHFGATADVATSRGVYPMRDLKIEELGQVYGAGGGGCRGGGSGGGGSKSHRSNSHKSKSHKSKSHKSKKNSRCH